LAQYGQNDPFCTQYQDKQCVKLCDDWYNSPVVSKPPVPPIESKDQTCLINCRTEFSKCSAAVDQQYNVVPWQPGPAPPQAYFNQLNTCFSPKYTSCLSSCRSYTAP
jgi:hypothetical protein